METSTASSFVGGIEAGGTRIVCALGRGPEDVARSGNKVEFPTGTSPGKVMSQVTSWLREKEAESGRKLLGVGIASFGALDLVVNSSTYGRITTTPKAGWSNTDWIGPIRKVFGEIPIGLDTDVNGAALGEAVWGAGFGFTDFVYITLGTGIGGGGMSRGQLLHGLVHPEMGHMRVPRVVGDMFSGVCPFHGDCWEGLCSGTAIRVRTGMAAEQLAANDPVWQLVAQYIAFAIANIICVLSPQRVIVGGGVSLGGALGQNALLRLVRERTKAVLKEYVVSSSLVGTDMSEYIVAPRLGDGAGICGSLALAQRAIAECAPATRPGKRIPQMPS